MEKKQENTLPSFTKQTALKYWIKETSGSLKRQIFQEKAGMLFAVTVSVLGENSEIR